MLHKLKAGPADNLADVGITHSREDEHPPEGADQVGVLRTPRSNRTNLIRNSGVENSQIACHATLDQFLDTLRRFVDERLIPAEAEVDATDKVPQAIVDEMKELRG